MALAAKDSNRRMTTYGKRRRGQSPARARFDEANLQEGTQNKATGQYLTFQDAMLHVLTCLLQVTMKQLKTTNDSRHNPLTSRKSSDDSIDDLANDILDDTPPQKKVHTSDERVDFYPVEASSYASPLERIGDSEAPTYALCPVDSQKQDNPEQGGPPKPSSPWAISSKQHGKLKKKHRRQGRLQEQLPVFDGASESLRHLPVSPPDELEVEQSSYVTDVNQPSSPDAAELSRRLTLLMQRDAEDVESSRLSYVASESPSKASSQKLTALQRGKGALRKVKRALSSHKGSTEATGSAWRDRFQSSTPRSVLSELTSLGRAKTGVDVQSSAEWTSQHQAYGGKLIKGESEAFTCGSALAPLPIYESMRTKRHSSISTEGLVSPSKVIDESPRGHRQTKSADFGALLKSEINSDTMGLQELLTRKSKSSGGQGDQFPLSNDELDDGDPTYPTQTAAYNTQTLGEESHVNPSSSTRSQTTPTLITQGSANTLRPMGNMPQVNISPYSHAQTDLAQTTQTFANFSRPAGNMSRANISPYSRSQTDLTQTTQASGNTSRSMGNMSRVNTSPYNRSQTDLAQTIRASVNTSRPMENMSQVNTSSFNRAQTSLAPTIQVPTNLSWPMGNVAQVNTSSPLSHLQMNPAQTNRSEVDLTQISQSHANLGRSNHSQTNLNQSTRSRASLNLFSRFRRNRSHTNLRQITVSGTTFDLLNPHQSNAGQASPPQTSTGVPESTYPRVPPIPLPAGSAEHPQYDWNTPHPLRMNNPMDFASGPVQPAAPTARLHVKQSKRSAKNAKIVANRKHLSTVPDAEEDPDAITPASNVDAAEGSSRGGMAYNESEDDGEAEDSADELGLDSSEHSERSVKLKRKSGSADLRNASPSGSASNQERIPLKRSTLAASSRRHGMHIFDVPEGKEKEITEEEQ